MTQGRTDQIGTPTEIYHHPETVFVAGFIGTANLLPVTVDRVDGDLVTLTSLLGSQFYAPTMGRSFERGANVTLMVRPERLDLATSPRQRDVGGSTNATLTSVVFQGPVLRCEATTQLGTVLVAHVHVDDMPTDARVGEPIVVSWVPGAAHVVNEKIDASQAGATTINEDETSISLGAADG
jgi:spermidine/putrescine transport system ATP-binding protein